MPNRLRIAAVLGILIGLAACEEEPAETTVEPVEPPAMVEPETAPPALPPEPGQPAPLPPPD